MNTPRYSEKRKIELAVVEALFALYNAQKGQPVSPSSVLLAQMKSRIY